MSLDFLSFTHSNHFSFNSSSYLIPRNPSDLISSPHTLLWSLRWFFAPIRWNFTASLCKSKFVLQSLSYSVYCFFFLCDFQFNSPLLFVFKQITLLDVLFVCVSDLILSPDYVLLENWWIMFFCFFLQLLLKWMELVFGGVGENGRWFASRDASRHYLWSRGVAFWWWIQCLQHGTSLTVYWKIFVLWLISNSVASPICDVHICRFPPSPYVYNLTFFTPEKLSSLL